MEVNDIHVGRQLFVSSGTGAGIGPAGAPSLQPTPIVAIPGTAWIENAFCVGDVTAFAPGEAHTLLARSPTKNPTAKAASIFKVTSRASLAPTGTPIDVMLGDPTGPCGVQIWAGLNPVQIQASSILTNAAITEVDLTVKKTDLNVSYDEVFAVKNDVGTFSEIGASSYLGATFDMSATFHAAPEQNLFTPATGAVDYASAFTTLLSTDLLAKSKKPFDIVHPTKEGWRLRYVCLEGPAAEVYFRGKLKDSNIIELPDYWRELVDLESITIHLTPIGLYQELYYEEVTWGSRIKVVNSNGGPIHCSYVVYGERKDTSKNIPEYKGLTPNDYPGDNKEYKL